ncbi:phytanoyl-CoA dioxygenase family protein [Microlunatus speluncae]|uniref:phytanoyl-CoA dioxygenase family protein n=1 Tax=Microlunatus speluncae TaxID=2594267 RepID=UPI001FEA12E5|nr:phytanoyl-CoA dioxygenase family protein [Microlunatus speluncae]
MTDHPVTSTSAALADLGVTDDSLSPEQRAQLDQDGFVILVGHIPDDLLAAFRSRTDELLEQEGAAAGHEVPQGGGVAALADLLNKGEIFERCYTDPAVLAAARQVIGEEFRVNSLNYRASLPGQGHQGLHGDWDGAVPDGDFHILNSMWVLDDFTEDNGATRLVPGSHRSGRWPADELEQTTDDHPDQIYATAPAGSVIIFNAHVWHGGTLNRTQRRRRGMTMSFRRRDEPQQLDQAHYIRKAVYDRISPAQRFLLDV